MIALISPSKAQRILQENIRERRLQLNYTQEGLTLMASFYETDSWAVESTTELDFDFELLFTDAGFEKFTDFATRCPDPDFVIQTVKHLLLDDGYCMRTMLLDEASTYLSEDGVKALRA